MKRKIAVITSSRADYGLLYWLLHAIAADPELELHVIATGAHLAPEFGDTLQHIRDDAWPCLETVDIAVDTRDHYHIANSAGLATQGVAQCLRRLQPDIVTVLGDRYEILSAVLGTVLMHIPVAHIHGGEVTLGAIDDSIRHAISKLAHLHFPVAEPYRQRLLQLGEAAHTIFNLGAPGLDHITQTKRLTRDELSQQLQVTFGPQNFLITFQPETANTSTMLQGLHELLAALNNYATAHLFFTFPNAEPEAAAIRHAIQQFVTAKPQQRHSFLALGSKRYLSLVEACDVVIGNSSSGYIEVPLLKRPTVNIGQRQQGRLQANTIINCDHQQQAIQCAIDKALSLEFQAICQHPVSPYGSGNSSYRIKETLKKVSLQGILKKTFVNLTEETTT